MPTTTRDLLTTLHPYGPAVEGGELILDADLPPALDAAVGILHTGVRALLSNRAWFGCGSERSTAAPRALDPGAPIPPGITLLCVEGDPGWDRIDPVARLDHPELFAVGSVSPHAGRPLQRS